MVELRVEGIASEWVEHVRSGGADANGQVALARVAAGGANPCRHCLGRVVPGPEIAGACRRILADPSIAYAHVRSKFNCFQCRIDRAR
jgi:hypothetical protein